MKISIRVVAFFMILFTVLLISAKVTRVYHQYPFILFDPDKEKYHPTTATFDSSCVVFNQVSDEYDMTIFDDSGTQLFKVTTNGTAEMLGFQMSTGASNGYVLTSDASGVGTWQASSGSGGTGQLIYGGIQLQSCKFPTTSPAVLTGNQNNYRVLFDASTDESIYWTNLIVDDSYSSVDSMHVFLYFSMVSATSGNVVWGIQIMAVTSGDAADINTDSYDTANLTTVSVPGTAGYMVRTVIYLGNRDSVDGGDYLRIKVYRDADNASDTATGDAELLAIAIRQHSY